MKRKSIFILIAVLALAVSIPLFALAESELGAQPADGTGFMYGRGAAAANADSTTWQNTRMGRYNGYGVDEDGYCYVLGENGEQQRLYALGANGEYTAVQSNNGAFCWSDEYLTENDFQTRRDAFEGGWGCRRWN